MGQVVEMPIESVPCVLSLTPQHAEQLKRLWTESREGFEQQNGFPLTFDAFIGSIVLQHIWANQKDQ